MRRKKENPIAEEVISAAATGVVIIKAAVRAEAVIAVGVITRVAITGVETEDPDIKKPVIFLIYMQGAPFRAFALVMPRCGIFSYKTTV